MSDLHTGRYDWIGRRWTRGRLIEPMRLLQISRWEMMRVLLMTQMEADLEEVKEEEPTGLARELDTPRQHLPPLWPLIILATVIATDSHDSNSSLAAWLIPCFLFSVLRPQEPTWPSCVQSPDMRELRGKLGNKGWNQWTNVPLVFSPSRKNWGQILYCLQSALAGLSLGLQRSDQWEDISLYRPSSYWLSLFPYPVHHAYSLGS